MDQALRSLVRNRADDARTRKRARKGDITDYDYWHCFVSDPFNISDVPFCPSSLIVREAGEKSVMSPFPPPFPPMDDETILNDWDPSEEILRRWAFDTTLLLSDQDEDLILPRMWSLPVLIPLADDPACPKADYILECIDYYLMFLVLRGTEDHLAQVREAAELARCAKQAKLHAWAGLQERRLRYREGLGPTSREQALTMSKELLNGICRTAKISIVGESVESWEVELSVPPNHRHKERLSISKVTGRFVFSG